MKFSNYNVIIELDTLEKLLINTLSGEMFKIDADTENIIKSNNIWELDKRIKDEYVEKGIIIDDEVNELNYIGYMQNKEKYSSKVLSLTILLTSQCNCRCTYCFQGQKSEKELKLTDKSREKIFKFIKNSLSPDIEIVSIVLFGGEPLLYFSENITWLDKIKELCTKENKKLITSMVTNGTKITDETLDKLYEYNCENIQITLDGDESMHNKRRKYTNENGSFKDVLEGIKKVYARKDFKKPTIRINIDKKNINNVYMLLKELRDADLIECFIDFGILKGDEETMKKNDMDYYKDGELGNVLYELWGQLKELGFKFDAKPKRRNMYCGLYGDKAFTITADAKVYKCWELLENDKYLVGRIDINGTIPKLEKGFYDWMSRDFLGTENCRVCSYLPICGGGCGSISEHKYGNVHMNGCFRTKSIYKEQVKFAYENKN
ncbi:MAG: radical SAM protein [Lachnospirales bacterium]